MSMMYSSESYDGGVALGGVPMGGKFIGNQPALDGKAAYQQAIAILKSRGMVPVRQAWAQLKAQTGLTRAVDLLAHLQGAEGGTLAQSVAAKKVAPRRTRGPKGRFSGIKPAGGRCPHCGGAWYDDLWSGVKQGVGLAAQAAPLAMALL